MKINYTVILTVFGRQEVFFDQISSLKNQTIQPKEIIVFIDKHPSKSSPEIKSYCNSNKIQFFESNINTGVWGRFAISLLAKGDYIFILDDDIIPGKKWFEHSLSYLTKYNCVIGGVGVLFKKNTSDYSVEKRIGWVSPNDKQIEADVIGHCWGAKRNFFEEFWKNSQDHYLYRKSGEDIQFSFQARKLGLSIIVPYHGSDSEYWSNIKGTKFGTNEEALSLNPKAVLRMAKYLKKVRHKGFKYLSETDHKKIVENEIGYTVKVNNGYIHYLKASILNILRKNGR